VAITQSQTPHNARGALPDSNVHQPLLYLRSALKENTQLDLQQNAHPAQQGSTALLLTNFPSSVPLGSTLLKGRANVQRVPMGSPVLPLPVKDLTLNVLLEPTKYMMETRTSAAVAPLATSVPILLCLQTCALPDLSQTSGARIALNALLVSSALMVKPSPQRVLLALTNLKLARPTALSALLATPVPPQP